MVEMRLGSSKLHRLTLTTRSSLKEQTTTDGEDLEATPSYARSAIVLSCLNAMSASILRNALQPTLYQVSC
jgi:hypothetical protein